MDVGITSSGSSLKRGSPIIAHPFLHLFLELLDEDLEERLGVTMIKSAEPREGTLFSVTWKRLPWCTRWGMRGGRHVFSSQVVKVVRIIIILIS